MKTKQGRSSWIAFGLFYVVLLIIIVVLDTFSDAFSLSYFGVQVFLISVGVGIFALMALLFPNLSAMSSILMAFTVGILTIIPAVLMGLGDVPGLWPQYFYIALGMATGSLLTLLSLRFAKRLTKKDQSDLE